MLISNAVDVGAVVRQRRIDLGMSQTELAERIDTRRQWMSRFDPVPAEAGLACIDPEVLAQIHAT